jgi:hypothetical protein
MLQNVKSTSSNFLLGTAVCILLLLMPLMLHAASLPPAVVGAHTVFVENETGFAELQYTAILELNKWGHFDLAACRDKADLVLRLDNGTRVHALPDGQFPATPTANSFADSGVPKGHTRIALLDPKTGETLWSGIHKTDGGKVKSGHLLDSLREAFEEYEKGKRK